MMMQMLAAGGIGLLSDDARRSDESNPKGYFELEAVRRIRGGSEAWLEGAEHSAVKVVAPLVGNLPENHRYKVIFMHRPLEQVFQSQQHMLERLGKEGTDIDSSRVHAAMTVQLRSCRTRLERSPAFEVLDVDYPSAVEEPAVVAERVAAFLGRTLDQRAMAAVVDAQLHRERV